ncbi:unnamed protein product [Xylocopa violacea]|uniref:Odorant receptor n=1 Tax=Xylocopa violacea TaxID=135666 RepID=A0ABP1PBH8_XYLVO
MRILQCTYFLLTICGCFPPPSWTTPFKKSLYHVYAVFTLLLLNSLLLSQILDVVFNVESQDEFSDNFCITLVVLVTTWKISTILIRRRSVLFLIDWLQKEPFLPVDAEEHEMRLRFGKISDWNTIGYTSLLLICAFWIYVRSLLTDFKNRKLTFRAWLPYDYSSASVFLLTFAHQTIAATICCFASVAGDSLYSGLLIHIYCQFEILEHRLKNIARDGEYTVRLCARHHDRIYKFARMVNNEFKLIVFFQFCISMSVLCFNLYRMTQIKMDSRFVETTLYSICTLTQIFYYCWYGNEVKLKSLQLPDMIFRSDWTSLNNNTKKAFLIVMRRSRKPIEFSTGHIISVNLDSFMSLLKTSYSAFNMMQQSQKS